RSMCPFREFRVQIGEEQLLLRTFRDRQSALHVASVRGFVQIATLPSMQNQAPQHERMAACGISSHRERLIMRATEWPIEAEQ
ncbi:hypothetical protein SB778_35795, partial [Paraburkholderia sp. SIMBA_050]